MMQPFSTAESLRQGLYVGYCNLALFYVVWVHDILYQLQICLLNHAVAS